MYASKDDHHEVRLMSITMFKKNQYDVLKNIMFSVFPKNSMVKLYIHNHISNSFMTELLFKDMHT